MAIDKLSKKHIEVILRVLQSIQDSDYFYTQNGNSEPKPSNKSIQQDKLLNEAVEFLSKKISK